MNTYLAIFLIVILVMFLAKVLKSIGKAAVIALILFVAAKYFGVLLHLIEWNINYEVYNRNFKSKRCF